MTPPTCRPQTSFITTASGQWVPTSRPAYIHIRLSDIARALSFQCRFNGHVSRFYSVGEHSILVGDLLWEMCPGPQRAYLALMGLMHDADEAYVGDIIYGIKQTLKPAISRLEARYDRAIHKSLLAVFPRPTRRQHALIKWADISLCFLERKIVITPEAQAAWESREPDPPGLWEFPPFSNNHIKFLPPEAACERFLAAFHFRESQALEERMP